MKMAMEVDGYGSGGTSSSQQGAGTENFCPPNLPFGGGGAVEVFVDFRQMFYGFLIGGSYRHRNQGQWGSRGPRPPCGRHQGLPVPRGCSQPVAPLRLCFVVPCCSGKNNDFGFCPVQFREY